MIIDFIVKNFKSIKEEQLFSMSAKNLRGEHPQYTFSSPFEKDVKLLRSTVIYGANASGKSNLLMALRAFRELVMDSTKRAEGLDIPYYQPFKLDQRCMEQPVSFELEFLGDDNIRYSYRISFYRKAVESEELVFYPKKRHALLFSRTNATIRLGSRLKGYNRLLKAGLFSNHLFLSYAAGKKIPYLDAVYRYFKDNLLFHTRADQPGRIAPFQQEELLADIKKKLTGFLAAADTGIHRFDLVTEEEKGPSVDIYGEIYGSSPGESTAGTPGAPGKIEYIPITYRKTYDGATESGYTRFSMDEESDGTVKMLELARKAILALETGYTFFIDELDGSLHPHLSAYILDLFNEPESNPNNAQLICTTHDISLLDPGKLRRDQIWFTSKDEYGASELFSLDEFKRDQLKKNTPYGEWYLDGRFGAVPLIDRQIAHLFAKDNEKRKQDGKD